MPAAARSQPFDAFDVPVGMDAQQPFIAEGGAGNSWQLRQQPSLLEQAQGALQAPAVLWMTGLVVIAFVGVVAISA